MRELESTLEQEFTQFNRIWVQYSNNGIYKICLTLFPKGEHDYRMVFGTVKQLNIDNIRLILTNHLETKN